MQNAALPERPCTPRKRLQFAQQEDHKTGQKIKITREATIRGVSAIFVGTTVQAVVSSSPRKHEQTSTSGKMNTVAT
ncbi:hypothetical protein F441_00511 [Phytophthora nicotianae CJ01A1]|uniref:Uncharacterized protein n=6 Tax=Phytophthora nicotianae TaxID=4792 RepID=W2RFE0_PHYN3|nr:hypothetical protein PPTG_20734 [Phytophthora nicotianae INRA-310]ETI57106.1 hypothetical protein F443_00513 [Phytophthora nicotianae P1569]ETK96880.1 hypothetical protein L915_00489 [Phytophthora nicotianae]ETO85873.1 hypothetical protein F444_00510 [Phytophthora nicotianae P1976]ETP26905.1 hypothetical protein F441_00511 [Phytophthora nicotianae CJ01A1]ETP54867.1 hypothetical protein F442_00504 [Phytophthora nicotianae P10297]